MTCIQVKTRKMWYAPHPFQPCDTAVQPLQPEGFSSEAEMLVALFEEHLLHWEPG